MLTRTRFVRTALRSPRFNTSLAVVILVLGFAILGPILAGHDPNAVVGMMNTSPAHHPPLGTDNFGRDELTLLMYGTRNSLEIGAIAGLVAVLIGVLVGTVAGFYGGITEEALMGATNVLITIPAIVVLILLSVALGSRSAVTMGLIIGVTSWPWTARAVAAQTSSLRTREHIDIARLSGASGFGIIVRDIIPYILSYLGMAFTLQLATAVLTEAALSLLGLGPTNTISLGILLQWSLLWEAVRQGVWWTFIPPTFFLSIVSFGLLLLNSSLDEIYNPRLQGGGGSCA
ncbi:MAG TPA: ABC transporter permease [Trueperaceae bacterium]|nr:ABC transporter permease [Trueperaceae bacterium]